MPQSKKGKKMPATIRPARVTFSGLTEDLKGNICDTGTGSQAYQFTATTKALASNSRRKCSNPQYIQISIDRKKECLDPDTYLKNGYRYGIGKSPPWKGY